MQRRCEGVGAGGVGAELQDVQRFRDSEDEVVV